MEQIIRTAASSVAPTCLRFRGLRSAYICLYVKQRSVIENHGDRGVVENFPPGPSCRGKGYARPVGARGLSPPALIPFSTVFFPAREYGRRWLYRMFGLGAGPVFGHQVCVGCTAHPVQCVCGGARSSQQQQSCTLVCGIHYTFTTGYHGVCCMLYDISWINTCRKFPGNIL